MTNYSHLRKLPIVTEKQPFTSEKPKNSKIRIVEIPKGIKYVQKIHLTSEDLIVEFY